MRSSRLLPIRVDACTHRAIENGANALAESFLFIVAAALILGESYRTSSRQSKRRDDVDDKLEALTSAVGRLQQATADVERTMLKYGEDIEGEQRRREALERVVARLVGFASHPETRTPMLSNSHTDKDSRP